jgi:amidase
MNDNTDNSDAGRVSRRTLLGLAAATSIATAAHGSSPKPATASRANDLVMMEAAGLARAIHCREVSCVEVMTAYLDHIEKLNGQVNAIVALQDRSDLLAQAQERDNQLMRGESMGPLHGFPK